MTAKRILPLLPILGVIATGGLPCHWQPGQPAGVPAAAAQAGRAQEVHVNLSEWSLSPSRIQVVPGMTVRLLATNDGMLAHALAVEGDGLYAETPTIGSRQTARLELTFAAPGIYDIYCPVAAGQHRALGQDGKVAAGPEAAALLDLNQPDQDSPEAVEASAAPAEPDLAAADPS